MADLDRDLREDLNDDVLLPCSGGDHVDHTHYVAVTNALRDVLDYMNRRDDEDDSDPSPNDVRRIIARALGIEP